MKPIFILFSLALTAIAGPSPNVGSVNLAWDYDFVASPNATNFVIYMGGASGTYTNSVSTGNTNKTISITNLVRGNTYYFAATAQGDGMESDFSNEIVYLVPKKPTKPTNLRAL